MSHQLAVMSHICVTEEKEALTLYSPAAEDGGVIANCYRPEGRFGC